MGRRAWAVGMSVLLGLPACSHSSTAGLPAGTRYFNLGISGATVQTALDKELGQALADRPTVVAVWLNVNDIIARVAPSKYESELQSLVHQLRGGGKTKVLVANTPPLDIIPAVRPFAFLATAVADQYNQAIGRVVKAEGAVLVDLHAAGLAAPAQRHGRLAGGPRRVPPLDRGPRRGGRRLCRRLPL